MTQVHQITPFLHVPNMEAALAFFCETLPFTVEFRQSNYAYIEFAGAGIRLLEEPERALTSDGNARVAVYVDVTGVDALYAQLRERLAQLPPNSVEPPRDQSWRQREFQVHLPDGDWLTFGEPIRASVQ